ncbi:hypothetical protein IQ22_00290 [Pseudomonas duriflava]|uniref:DUF2066 domain-containing protein n=1 Tax=Pseudomonas duriflava TaxID=459528 RepID=A0A562QPB8_9PSED|nr:DUF2066 domain-containing protein [Pseudomonas duriflava]TWI58584.1 hypothetical protein IQ22_00290 [Pseudomonas duriflava]
MRRFALSLMLCLPLLSQPVTAEVVEGLYQVREPVSSQSPADRDAALAKALQDLVIRLTGDPQATQKPALAEMLKDPQQLITQYGYDAGPPAGLVINFDPASINRTLTQAGLPIWGANRPVVLAWWLNDSETGSTLIGDGQAAAEPLRRAARNSGLPLRLPLADLSEQLVGTAETIDAGKPDALREASERYNADALLTVHAKQVGNGWQAQWRMWTGTATEQGSAQGADNDALVSAILQDITTRLARQYVVKPGAAQALTLVVDGANFERYAQLQKLLEPMGGRLLRAENGQLRYQLNVNPAQLQAQLGLANLEQTSAPLNADTAPTQPQAAAVEPAQNVLYYRWP